MIYNINGLHFYNLIDYGIRNLAIYKDKVNALNVFPVPDGDTGTNMLITLQNGFSAIRNCEAPLYEMAKQFSNGIVLGARGNSGVILSQFFKGVSESFFTIENADFYELVGALENGVKYAYGAVSKPIEGTILTVVRESIEQVRKELDDYKIDSIDDIFKVLLTKAKSSLDTTMELLETLKSANVVDSGGAGILYVFEGMQKYISGDSLPVVKENQQNKIIDYSYFNSASKFEFGYCTELVIQRTDNKEVVEPEQFKKEITKLGDSLVISFEDDKIKVHIHTFMPENVLYFCHRFGEFLNIKIENMSVQHQENHRENLNISQRAPSGNDSDFSVIAVAHNNKMAQSFSEMGADVVLSGKHSYLPTASDFVNAFEAADAENILVFPNNKNTELTALQACSLYGSKNIVVMHTKFDTECYAVLPMLDYSASDLSEFSETARVILENLNTIYLTRAFRDAVFGEKKVMRTDYISFDGDILVSSNQNLLSVIKETAKYGMSDKLCEVVTIFIGNGVDDSLKSDISTHFKSVSPLTEIVYVETDDDFYNLVFSFE